MAQYLERFEQGRLQPAVFPGGLFDNRLEKMTLLRGRLLEEKFARPTRQTKHVNCLINRGGRGLLDILNLPQQALLLLAQRVRLLVEELPSDAPVDLVHVHRLYSGLDLFAPGPQLLHRLRTRGLLSLIGGENFVSEPVEDRLRNHQPA